MLNRYTFLAVMLTASFIVQAEESQKRVEDVDFYKAIPSSKAMTSHQRFFATLPAGQQVFDPPEQNEISTFKWVKKGKYQLGYTDKFMIRGMLISKRHYLGDPKADIAPYDFVLGWKRMSDPSVIKQIQVLQNNRFYYWRVNDFPIPRKEIELTSTNLHLVPDTPAIAAQLENLKRGDVVSLAGYLTDIKDDNQFVWPTSRSRKDSGDGACEIVLVKRVSLIKHASD